MVTATYDQVTGISVAEVRAFTPGDAYLITSELAKLAEQLINEVANRPQRDAVRFAESEVKRAEERLKLARNEVTQFRNSQRLIDPQTSVVTTNVLLAQTLRQNLAQLQTELSTLQQRNISNNSPIVQTLMTRIKATSEQLALVESQVTTVKDGNTPLSKVVADFEQLDLERQFAQGMVTSAMQGLEQARSSAMSQHVYVTPYVTPMRPQSSTYPRRLLSIGIVAFGLFLGWLVGLLLVRSIREHLV
jgi:capsular polysaccharide transport system permease protein